MKLVHNEINNRMKKIVSGMRDYLWNAEADVVGWRSLTKAWFYLHRDIEDTINDNILEAVRNGIESTMDHDGTEAQT